MSSLTHITTHTHTHNTPNTHRRKRRHPHQPRSSTNSTATHQQTQLTSNEAQQHTLAAASQPAPHSILTRTNVLYTWTNTTFSPATAARTTLTASITQSHRTVSRSSCGSHHRASQADDTSVGADEDGRGVTCRGSGSAATA